MKMEMGLEMEIEMEIRMEMLEMEVGYGGVTVSYG